MTDRVAIVLPGVRYTTARPLVHFTRAVLESHGWAVLEASWPSDDAAEHDPQEMVTSVATGLIESAGDARVLVVGKSIGSLAIPLAASRGFPGIWFTPLLRHPRSRRRSHASRPEHSSWAPVQTRHGMPMRRAGPATA
jgi:hypothetical protein